jgi:hypothetical protein
MVLPMLRLAVCIIFGPGLLLVNHHLHFNLLLRAAAAQALPCTYCLLFLRRS